MKKNLNITKICTGVYSYIDKKNEMQLSHAVYGVCENQKVWKWIPKKSQWIEIEDSNDNSPNFQR